MPSNLSNIYKFSSLINTSLAKEGLLVASSGADGKINVMTIGWGEVGVLWSKPFFIAFIRKSRYTYELIEQSGDFTVNVPPKGFEKIIDFCGSKTGRKVDKIKKLGLKVQPSKAVMSPTLSDCLVTLECKVMFEKRMAKRDVPSNIKKRFYKNDDYHTCYFSEIVNITSRNIP
jgi:flavin reductase (DIM6/NTAB) family NADH-FMN oxidoreductase RutF